MDPKRRARVEALFEEALELEPAEWDTWLPRAAGSDPDLLQDVRALLVAHARTGGILDRGMVDLAGELVERARPPVPVGPYRILEEVGRGGMSVVYRAERSDGQFRRRVALKVLRGELDAEELHVRLATERQILASLDHPNIARLLDGGMTEEGRPYLVMEYVEGRPLNAHCDEGRLSLEARLRLFLEVARAVQHAHARLVVHRDLKPSNILVTPEGRVRLLDFGIAKVLDVRQVELDEESAPVTRVGTRLFTPEYASPEQLAGSPASTANDVWALGVVLYELLVGARPFGGSEAGLERRIREEDPPRPSLRVLHGDSGWAAQRSTTRRALARALEGDLDRITVMALRKEPERRYASVEQFAEDVERYLSGLPVRAQSDRAAYRMRKFVRRHRTESAAAIVVLLALVGGAGVAVWQARETGVERDRAEVAAARSDAVAGYLLDLFRTADPWEVPADRLSARELLARGERRLSELPDDPFLRSQVLLAMGETYQSLGDGEAARPLLEEAVELRRAALGDIHPKTGEALLALAELRRREGRLAQAESLALSALAGSNEASHVAGHATALDLLGFIYTGMGRLAEAERTFLTEVEVLERGGLGDSVEMGSALINLAAVFRREGQVEQAEILLRRALEHRRRNLGPEHPLTAVVLARLGALLAEHLGRPVEAEESFRQALAIQTAVLGEDHPARAETLVGLASLHAHLGRDDRAEDYYREILRILSVGLGPEHPNTLEGMEGLAGHLGKTGRLQEADSLFRMAVATRRRTLGPEHPTLAGSLVGWGRVLLESGRMEEAESAFLEALAIREGVFGPDHPLAAWVLVDLAGIHWARGEHDAGGDLVDRAESILARHLPADHPELIRVRDLLDSGRGGS